MLILKLCKEHNKILFQKLINLCKWEPNQNFMKIYTQINMEMSLKTANNMIILLWETSKLPFPLIPLEVKDTLMQIQEKKLLRIKHSALLELIGD